MSSFRHLVSRFTLGTDFLERQGGSLRGDNPAIDGSRFLCWAVALALVLVASNSAQAKVYRLSPKKPWFQVLNGSGLKPGDEVILARGRYLITRHFSIGHQGTAEQPILIRAADRAKVVFRCPKDNYNVMNIEGAQYLILRGLEITGGSSGIRINKNRRGNPAKFIVLQNNHIHHVGDAAVTANQPDNRYEGMLFQRNHIHHTAGVGEAFYLGSNDNKSQFFDSIIEQNYIHHLNGRKVKQGDGIEIKLGSYNNIIRDNVIHETNYPGIVVYGTAGNGPPNVIERNVIWGTNDHAIQAASDAIIRNNVVFSTKGDGIHCRTHQGAVPGNLQIINNTVRCNGRSILVELQDSTSLTGPVLIANNALYPMNGDAITIHNTTTISNLQLLKMGGNFGTGRTVPEYPTTAFNNSGDFQRDFVDFEIRNAFLSEESLLRGAAVEAFLPDDDFGRRPRGKTKDVGALSWRKGEAAYWAIDEGFKKFPRDASR